MYDQTGRLALDDLEIWTPERIRESFESIWSRFTETTGACCVQNYGSRVWELGLAEWKTRL